MKLRQPSSPGSRSAPTTLILLFFFVLPMLVVIAVSFFDYENAQIIETFITDNYHDIFTSSVTIQQYSKSLEFAAIVWALTLVIGFNVSYFLVFHVRGVLWQIGLFLLCTVPFWTSNIIRMISWMPVLGKNGIFNQRCPRSA